MIPWELVLWTCQWLVLLKRTTSNNIYERFFEWWNHFFFFLITHDISAFNYDSYDNILFLSKINRSFDSYKCCLERHFTYDLKKNSQCLWIEWKYLKPHKMHFKTPLCYLMGRIVVGVSSEDSVAHPISPFIPSSQ